MSGWVERLCPAVQEAQCFDLQQKKWIDPYERESNPDSDSEVVEGVALGFLATPRNVRAARFGTRALVQGASKVPLPGWFKIGAVALALGAGVFVALRRGDERHYDPPNWGENPLLPGAEIILQSCTSHFSIDISPGNFERRSSFIVALTMFLTIASQGARRRGWEDICEEGKEVFPPPHLHSCLELINRMLREPAPLRDGLTSPSADELRRDFEKQFMKSILEAVQIFCVSEGETPQFQQLF